MATLQLCVCFQGHLWKEYNMAIVIISRDIPKARFLFTYRSTKCLSYLNGKSNLLKFFC